MAYSDTRGLPRFNAVSIGGAFLINGVMLAGFAMLKPEILPGYIYTPIELIEPTPDPMVPEPRPIEEAPRESVLSAPVPSTPLMPKPALPFTTTTTTTTTTGSQIDPIPDPVPLAIEPVFRGARLDPRYASSLQPAYPLGMIRNGVEGSVTVKVLIGADGRVKDVQAVRAAEQDFLAATRKQALGKWRFLPATRDGVAVESWREMTVRFTLPD